MIKFRFLLPFLLITLFIINTGCFPLSEVKAMNTSLQNAIEIVNKELLKQGIDANQYKISADEKNSVWNSNFLSNDKFKKDNPAIIEKLGQKDYWAIKCHYKNNANLLGGERWFFVDKKTGEVILEFSLK